MSTKPDVLDNMIDQTDSCPVESSPVKISYSEPKYKSYFRLKNRLRTFTTWPKYLHPDAEELARAGFVYTGCGDLVFCFYCGIHLKNWCPHDKSIDEHKKWSKRCVFVAMTAPEKKIKHRPSQEACSLQNHDEIDDDVIHIK